MPPPNPSSSAGRIAIPLRNRASQGRGSLLLSPVRRDLLFGGMRIPKGIQRVLRVERAET